ncbi:hypothetical protein DPMN_079127 [Dreissena polymorpha]|uniref:Uncharacterized protein n=1 Tax=Dreissena polymorpha TaxID=45954 RepID=A0A9D4BSQ8_DREPO|nr:hypothetical protein DPMN_079127 [Dreissena polymorpha]
MILKSDNERHSYGLDKLIPPARQPASQPARQPASQPARIRQSNNQFFPSENLVKKGHNSIKMTTRVMQLVLLLSPYDSLRVFQV